MLIAALLVLLDPLVHAQPGPCPDPCLWQWCDDVQFEYTAAWAGGFIAMVRVGSWQAGRDVRLNFGHDMAGGRPVKLAKIDGASLIDNVQA